MRIFKTLGCRRIDATVTGQREYETPGFRVHEEAKLMQLAGVGTPNAFYEGAPITSSAGRSLTKFSLFVLETKCFFATN